MNTNFVKKNTTIHKGGLQNLSEVCTSQKHKDTNAEGRSFLE